MSLSLEAKLVKLFAKANVLVNDEIVEDDTRDGYYEFKFEGSFEELKTKISKIKQFELIDIEDDEDFIEEFGLNSLSIEYDEEIYITVDFENKRIIVVEL